MAILEGGHIVPPLRTQATSRSPAPLGLILFLKSLPSRGLSKMRFKMVFQITLISEPLRANFTLNDETPLGPSFACLLGHNFRCLQKKSY